MVVSAQSNESMQAPSSIATDQHASILPTDQTRLRSTQSRVHLARSASWSPAAHVEDPNSVAFTFFEDDLLPQDDWLKSEARLANIGPPPQMPREFKRYPPDVIPNKPAVEPAQESKITISRTLLVSEQQSSQTIELERTTSIRSPSSPPLRPILSAPTSVLAFENKPRFQHRPQGEEDSQHLPAANVPVEDTRADNDVPVRNRPDPVEKESPPKVVTSAQVMVTRAENDDLVSDVPNPAELETENDKITMGVKGPRPEKEEPVRGVPLSREPSLRAREPSTLVSTLARSVSFFGRRPKDATKDTRPSSRPITPTKKRSNALLKSFSSNNIPSLARSDLPLRPLSVVIPPPPPVQTSKAAAHSFSKTRDELWNAFRALDAEYSK